MNKTHVPEHPRAHSGCPATSSSAKCPPACSCSATIHKQTKKSRMSRHYYGKNTAKWEFLELSYPDFKPLHSARHPMRMMVSWSISDGAASTPSHRGKAIRAGWFAVVAIWSGSESREDVCHEENQSINWSNKQKINRSIRNSINQSITRTIVCSSECKQDKPTRRQEQIRFH